MLKKVRLCYAFDRHTRRLRAAASDSESDLSLLRYAVQRFNTSATVPAFASISTLLGTTQNTSEAMTVLQDNDQFWVGLELHVRAFAKRLDCTYLSYPLGSKKPMQQPKPSLPTDKYLYMSLPHAIGIVPPVETYSLIVVATMSAKTFFEYAVEKLGIDLATPPTGRSARVEFESMAICLS